MKRWTAWEPRMGAAGKRKWKTIRILLYESDPAWHVQNYLLIPWSCEQQAIRFVSSGLLGSEAVYTGRWLRMFRRKMLYTSNMVLCYITLHQLLRLPFCRPCLYMFSRGNWVYALSALLAYKIKLSSAVSFRRLKVMFTKLRKTAD